MDFELEIAYLRCFRLEFRWRIPTTRRHLDVFFLHCSLPMVETWEFRQLLRCVLHATMSTSFIVRVPVQNPCSPNGRPGHCKTTTLHRWKTFTSKMEVLCLVRLVLREADSLTFTLHTALVEPSFRSKGQWKKVYAIVHRAILSSKWCYGGFPLCCQAMMFGYVWYCWHLLLEPRNDLY